MDSDSSDSEKSDGASLECDYIDKSDWESINCDINYGDRRCSDIDAIRVSDSYRSNIDIFRPSTRGSAGRT